MLGKLIKYEFKATAKWFLVMYAAVIILTVFNKLSMILNASDVPFMGVVNVILTTTYILTIFASYILTLVLIITRFYKSMITDEGYLTHTLPVKTISHVNSKLIVAVVWFILSVIVMIASFMILGAGEGLIEFFSVIGEVFIDAKKEGILSNLVITLILILVILFIALLYNILIFYCSIALGNLFNKHKIAGSIGMYFIIYFVMEIFSMIFSLILFSSNFEAALTDAILTDDITYMFGELFGDINTLLITSGLYSLVFAAIFYVITNVILSKKLNLE